MTGIVELVRVCDEQYAVNLGWFTMLGGWVADEPDAELQRLFATAAHRHAWHADLWADRRPRIPPDSIPELPTPAKPATSDDRVGSYREALGSMRATLADLDADLDPDLDPSTRRVISLVDADLVDLAARLP